ncbi:hypothetical protein EW146_g5945 [Bondarzewia mesenterica]|uniref:Glycosyl hydrolase family 30 TIM-barrel domain-containing protein n=1 Tax=Bondarzewia mesenterica TaxID=1095465 RepID=A0A4S4LR03_9AGAM|nr:hypothetical protein EW146_g5945 [Bondarzewia mesenterica]
MDMDSDERLMEDTNLEAALRPPHAIESLIIMYLLKGVLPCAAFGKTVLGQQIYDISNLFTELSLSSSINFITPGAIGDADIVVDDSTTYQGILGFGASLTDSSATLLANFKIQKPDNYWSILGSLFDPTDGNWAAGLTFVRVPLGASDFSTSYYSFDDVSGDTGLSSFNINKAPSAVFTVLKDIQTINSYLRVILTPWSPPAWMKSGGSMQGGSFTTSLVSTYANYLLNALQGFKNNGVTAYAISIQNEPENGDTSYPTCSMPVTTMAQIGTALRTLLNNNGFSGTKIIGYEHNWADAANYPVQLVSDLVAFSMPQGVKVEQMQQASSAFDGVSFHCYEGTVDQQDSFYSAYPSKDIYFTECTGEIGTDWWSNIKWYMDNIFIGALEHNARSGMMWNLALDGSGQPILSGSDSCPTACQGVVTINSDGSYSLNEEFYSMAQASRAILPRDVNGPWGQRIGVSVGGSSSWALRVAAYATGRVSSSDWHRYSLVVLNWDDSSSTSWNPQSVKTTIEFRGMQASYTFPVGVTTLWWYATATSSSKRSPVELYSSTNGTRHPRQFFV